MDSPLATDVYLYKDQKFGTWAINEPKIGTFSIPLLQAASESYGKKTILQSTSKQELIDKIEEYSANNKRKLSKNETDLIFSYGSFAAVAGGTMMAVSKVFGGKPMAYGGAFMAILGVGIAGTAKVLEPSAAQQKESQDVSVIL